MCLEIEKIRSLKALKVGDTITKVNGQRLVSAEDAVKKLVVKKLGID